MSESAIKVENISKAYRIGLREQRHDTLGATMASWVKSPFKNFKRLKSLSNFSNHDDADIFWALKDINFEVRKGEVLGIIGKNGAGKSTLLKILSRITEPTGGRIEIYGRIASLLEVGTGFNPELTGRENVYLNGTILGMTKKEIDLKFDEIIDFSGIQKFIDTPVKRYSSGMKVRLAFAVAAHLESEILIVDEVLAVGDAEFQQKCLGKMSQISKADGRTVLFVSHNMAAVKNLCQRGIALNQGSIIFDGIASNAIDLYFSNGLNMSETGVIPLEMKRNFGSDLVKFTRVQLINHNNQPHQDFYYGEPIKVMVGLSIFKEIPNYNISIMIGTLDGQRILFSELNSDNSDKYGLLKTLVKGNYQLELEINTPLLPGSYSTYLGFSLLHGTTLDWVERVHDFHVNKTGFIKNEHYRWDESHGFVLNRTNWKLISI